MSVEFKNWQEICKKKDDRIKELEGKFDLIVEKLEEAKTGICLYGDELDIYCLDNFNGTDNVMKL